MPGPAHRRSAARLLPPAHLTGSAAGALHVREAAAVYRPRHPERTLFYRLLDRHFDRYLVFFGQAHLEHTIREYVAHDHERNHQGLDNELIDPDPLPGFGAVTNRQRLGGLLSFYHRVAA